MVDEKTVLDYANSLSDVLLDCPFPADFETVALRHKQNRKWFGLLFYVKGNKVGLSTNAPVAILNLKCDTALSYFLREQYCGVIAAYHMNKTHWNTVILEQIEWDVLQKMIDHSYSLTKK